MKPSSCNQKDKCISGEKKLMILDKEVTR